MEILNYNSFLNENKHPDDYGVIVVSNDEKYYWDWEEWDWNGMQDAEFFLDSIDDECWNSKFDTLKEVMEYLNQEAYNNGFDEDDEKALIKKFKSYKPKIMGIQFKVGYTLMRHK